MSAPTLKDFTKRRFTLKRRAEMNMRKPPHLADDPLVGRLI